MPIEPIIPLEKEYYFNQRGGKIFFDARKHPQLPLHEGSQIYHVLSVGINQDLVPIVTIEKNGGAECFRLPNGLSDWASTVISMAMIGENPFPVDVIFSTKNDRYYADIL